MPVLTPVPNPEIVAKVLQTMRPYFRRLREAWGDRWREELEQWFEVERYVTADDQQMSAANKANWLAALDVLEREVLSAKGETAQSDSPPPASSPPSSANTAISGDPAKLSPPERLDQLLDEVMSLVNSPPQVPPKE